MRQELLDLWKERLVFGTRYLDLDAIDDLVDGVEQGIWPLEDSVERPNDLSISDSSALTLLPYPEGYDVLEAPISKIKVLRKYLSSQEDPQVFRDLELACCYLAEHAEHSVLVDIINFFDTPQYSLEGYDRQYDTSTIHYCHNSIGKSGVVFYTKNINSHYEHSDYYYQKFKHPGIVMPASLGRHIECRGSHLPVTSDLAIYMRTYEGRDLPLRVLGELYLSHGYFQIKPYSIDFAFERG